MGQSIINNSITEKINIPDVEAVPVFIERLYSKFHNRPLCMIFDSALNNNSLGRYSIILFDPFLVFKSTGNAIEITQNPCTLDGYSEFDGKNIYNGATKHDSVRKLNGDPFNVLKGLLAEIRSEPDFSACSTHRGEIPFKSGCAGYFSYDLCNLIEELPEKKADPDEIPDIYLGFYNNSIVIDHKNSCIYINSSSEGIQSDDRTKIAILKQKLADIKSLVEQCIISDNKNTAIEPETFPANEPASNYNKDEYLRMVEKAREYIRNGDIYQVNLSQKFSTTINQDPFLLYLKLRNINAAPFSSYLNYGELKVLCSSPERFIRLTGDVIETRPVKGTRPRGKTSEEDLSLSQELLASGKDRAELTMIVDLERNDIGRVCKTGTVKVEKLFEVEKYATVFHLVSTIKAVVRKGTDAIDCIKAAFPGGSITGAPKIRSMEIINELESSCRGIYTGSIGYIDFCGNMDLNIAIRTIIVNGNKASFNVGGGIVWDSIPADEYEETLAKGEALLKVLSGS